MVPKSAKQVSSMFLNVVDDNHANSEIDYGWTRVKSNIGYEFAIFSSSQSVRRVIKYGGSWHLKEEVERIGLSVKLRKCSFLFDLIPSLIFSLSWPFPKLINSKCMLQ